MKFWRKWCHLAAPTERDSSFFKHSADERGWMLKKLRCQQMVLLCGVKSIVFSRLIFHFMEIHPNCHSSVIDQPRNWIFYTLWKVFLSGKSCSLWRIALCIQVAFFYSTFAVFLPVYAKNTFRKKVQLFSPLKKRIRFWPQ